MAMGSAIIPAPRVPGHVPPAPPTKPLLPAPPEADRVAWLPPPPGAIKDETTVDASAGALVGALQFDAPAPVTQRAGARLPERLSFDDELEDEHTLVDPPSFSGDRTTLVRPFPPPSNKGR